VLLRFRVANHRSIRDEYELSLIGTEFNEGTARRTPPTNKGRPVTVSVHIRQLPGLRTSASHRLAPATTSVAGTTRGTNVRPGSPETGC
jgi:hypothetical protein